MHPCVDILCDAAHEAVGGIDMIERIDEKIQLDDGRYMPGIGFGCYKMEGPTAYEAIQCALDTGYRLIDTASFYQNEEIVGRAVREAGVGREEAFVLSKIWPTEYSNPVQAIENSLKKLDLGYMDAYLLHWPAPDRDQHLRAYEAMLEYQQKELIRCVGVSNFEIEELLHLEKTFGQLPAVNQIELHPLMQRGELVDFCVQRNVAVMAWGPIFRGKISAQPVIEEIAAQHSKSMAQVTLRWHIQHGFIPLPKASQRAHILENSQLFDFALDEQAMQRLDALDCGQNLGRLHYDGE